MIAQRSVKEASPRTVGVIASRADLARALAMRKPPDLFELRLDRLVAVLDELEDKLSMLSAKKRSRHEKRVLLIVTARHPREGGANNLSLRRRRELLMRFLPWAHFVDVELRSAPALRSVLEMARQKNVRSIFSFHDFHSMPDFRSLHAMARRAKTSGADIFKLAVRTDTQHQLARLLDFVDEFNVDLPLSVMGIGKLGLAARRALIQRGSVLNYAAFDRTRIVGQPTISEIRRWTLSVCQSSSDR